MLRGGGGVSGISDLDLHFPNGLLETIQNWLVRESDSDAAQAEYDFAPPSPVDLCCRLCNRQNPVGISLDNDPWNAIKQVCLSKDTESKTKPTSILQLTARLHGYLRRALYCRRCGLHQARDSSYALQLPVKYKLRLADLQTLSAEV